VNWYILAVLKATQRNEITLSDLEICPFKLGINFAHPRRAIIDSEEMIFSRNQQGVEVIRVRD
jgi:hypothetical protein